MTATQHKTFCRTCEALCGLIAETENGRLVALRGDPGHPVSQGYACAKGVAMGEVQYDADRVINPLRRTAGGGFEPVSWDAALDDIGARMSALWEQHGPGAIGWYLGNPGGFSHSHTTAVMAFMRAIGSPQLYSSLSQDGGSRFAASALVFGRPRTVPLPDIDETRFLLMLGANPFVSNGSLMVAPRVRQRMRAIIERGGRVVVVDPRRTETARSFEHLPIRPSTDAWLLLSLLHVVLGEGLVAEGFLAAHTTGLPELRMAVARFSPEETAPVTGVPADRTRELARSFAQAEGAVVYGRTGVCTSSHGTLIAALMDALNAVTGNLDRRGGAVFGWTPTPFAWASRLLGIDSYGKRTSRLGGFPDVLGFLPATLLGEELSRASGGPLRALIVSAGNPVLSVPGGERLRSALRELDLLVSIDLYLNETNRAADYVLPATTWLERSDIPLVLLPLMLTPALQWTEPVLAPAGEAREERAVVAGLVRRMSSPRLGRKIRLAAARAVFAVDWRLPIDAMLRVALPRRRLSLARLARGAVVISERVPLGRVRANVAFRDGRMRLAPGAILDEIDRLDDGAVSGTPEFPLLLIGRRDARSLNSWLHNAPSLQRGGARHQLLIHPDDAAAAGVGDGDDVEVASAFATVKGVTAAVTDEMVRGTVSLPHGWGHEGGWSIANAAGGANVNELTPTGPDSLERLAGMARLNGVAVRVEGRSR